MKDDSVYLLNYVKYILQDRPLEIYMDDDNNMDENVAKSSAADYWITVKNDWNDEKKYWKIIINYL